MAFTFTYNYPDNNMPQITVESIEEGYKFRLCKEDGTETNTFSISKDIIHNLQAATGYDGKEADAIEKFRKFGKEHYPDFFKNSM
ncbi:MAG TPA: hypothetical protein VHD35_03725 [Chitinophagaceae bacterium]|nr:hypothetical protein [Chitinophagaceae bacterium]